MKRNKFKGIFVAVLVSVCVLPLIGHVFWMFRLYRKHHDDPKGSMVSDLITFAMIEHHAYLKGITYFPYGLVYLSDWENGERHFDYRERRVEADGSQIFRYWYLNPLHGAEWWVDVKINPNQSRSWPQDEPTAGSSLGRDYAIVSLKGWNSNR